MGNCEQCIKSEEEETLHVRVNADDHKNDYDNTLNPKARHGIKVVIEEEEEDQNNFVKAEEVVLQDKEEEIAFTVEAEEDNIQEKNKMEIVRSKKEEEEKDEFNNSRVSCKPFFFKKKMKILTASTNLKKFSTSSMNPKRILEDSSLKLRTLLSLLNRTPQKQTEIWSYLRWLLSLIS